MMWMGSSLVDEPDEALVRADNERFGHLKLCA